MTVVQFPGKRPTLDDVLPVVYRVGSMCPRWSLQCHSADDGQPYVVAVSFVTGATFGAHWANGQWAVLTEKLQVVCKSPDLSTALELALS